MSELKSESEIEEMQLRLREFEMESVRSAIVTSTDAENRIVDRVGGLASLVFGLSLLALQIENPSSSSLIVLAWLFLGGAIAFSLAGDFIAVSLIRRQLVTIVSSWLKLDEIPRPRETLTKINTSVQITTISFLVAGVLLLIAFGVENITNQ